MENLTRRINVSILDTTALSRRHSMIISEINLGRRTGRFWDQPLSQTLHIIGSETAWIITSGVLRYNCSWKGDV